MVPPHRPVDQATRLDQLRHDADMAIARMLRAVMTSSETRVEAIAQLDRACAVLQNDVRIYRRRLMEEIASIPPPPRHLRLVLTSAASTAAAIGMRSSTGQEQTQ
jgi:hypothetical protein